MIRSDQYDDVGEHTKCFFNTDTVYGLHQHFSYSCIAEGESRIYYQVGNC